MWPLKKDFERERVIGMPILEMENISKSFGGVKALKNVNLNINEGETIALVGQNGAGKSTLMKILTGAYRKDEGIIRLHGEVLDISSTIISKEHGIAQVYQSAELVPEFTVAENIVLGDPSFSKSGFINDKKMLREAQKLLDHFGIPLNAGRKIGGLSGAMRQLVAIAKVLYKKPEIIIWDEPTAVLSDKEVRILFSIVNELKRGNTTMIYISHRLEEIFQICDRVAVMRDGELIAVMDNLNLTKDQLIEKMLGRSLEKMYAEKHFLPNDEAVLKVSGLTTKKVRDISFELHKSEILGFAGLVNSGRTETVRAIFGLDRVLSGTIAVNGKEASIKRSTDAAKLGLFLAPEDRKKEALVLCRPIRENISLSNLKVISSFGVCKNSKETERIETLCRRLNIKMNSIEDTVSDLSGGNQQKVVVAKAIMAAPDILIFDEPTQGIDVGAKAEIYELLEQLRNEGMSIIVISSEIEEIQMVCDRAIVLHDGRLTGSVSNEELKDTELILQYMYRSVDNEG